MWELDYNKSWVPWNWCFWTVVLEKTLESPLNYKEIQSVHPKGNQSWIFIGRTNAEVETPILWPLDVKSWLIWNDPDAVKDWRQEETGTTEDEMAGWHHWLHGHVWVNAGVGDGQEGPVCCSPWDRMSQTWLSNWTELSTKHSIGASLVAQTVKNLPAMLETQVDPWVRKIPWRRKWQPIPVFLLGEFHEQKSLAGYSPWGPKESVMTEH